MGINTTTPKFKKTNDWLLMDLEGVDYGYDFNTNHFYSKGENKSKVLVTNKELIKSLKDLLEIYIAEHPEEKDEKKPSSFFDLMLKGNTKDKKTIDEMFFKTFKAGRIFTSNDKNISLSFDVSTNSMLGIVSGIHIYWEPFRYNECIESLSLFKKGHWVTYKCDNIRRMLKDEFNTSPEEILRSIATTTNTTNTANTATVNTINTTNNTANTVANTANTVASNTKIHTVYYIFSDGTSDYVVNNGKVLWKSVVILTDGSTIESIMNHAVDRTINNTTTSVYKAVAATTREEEKPILNIANTIDIKTEEDKEEIITDDSEETKVEKTDEEIEEAIAALLMPKPNSVSKKKWGMSKTSS